ncbi:MAG: hypothetical protein EKK57_11395 [Proteobacteria bacterium]|nr:MAG: hypothetical protein EKK57_11395 [Pseudomonadota bacterium]
MREVHKGQKRRDGKEYFTHLEAVAKLVGENNLNDNIELHEDLMIVGLAHDAAEDHNYSPKSLISELNEIGLPSERGFRIIQALELLDKRKYSSYASYILSIRAFWMAVEVKIADLTHNLSDLGKGSQRDKYELAKHILMS